MPFKCILFKFYDRITRSYFICITKLVCNIRKMFQHCVMYINHRRLQFTLHEQRRRTLFSPMVEIGKFCTFNPQNFILVRPERCSLVHWNEVFHIQARGFDMRHNMLANLRADFWHPAAALASSWPLVAFCRKFDISEITCTTFHSWRHHRLGFNSLRKQNICMWSCTYYHDLHKLGNPWR